MARMSQNTWISWISAIPHLRIILITYSLNFIFFLIYSLLQFSLLDFNLGFATFPLPGGLLPLLFLYCYCIGWQIHLLKWFITPAHRAVAVLTEQTDLSICSTDIFIFPRCSGMGSSGSIFVIAKEKHLKEQGARQMSRQRQRRESKEKGFDFPVLWDIN